MANFTPIRDIPQQGLSEWEFAVLSAMKENIEIMMGARQSGVRAVTSDSIRTEPVSAASYQQMLAEGAGSSYSGSPTYALHSDYVKLIQSVVNLAYDVQQLRGTVNALITQIRS